MFTTDSDFNHWNETTEAPYSLGRIKKKWKKDRPQTYIGDGLHRNIHRHGFYLVDHGEKLFYDGLFYANKLEGYAHVFYHNGSHFQGLFKNNLRFGPGVWTYSNGTQDVGLWYNNIFMRMGGLDKDNLMPKIASTSAGQTKLLKYRYLVPVHFKTEDIAYGVLKKLGANESILEQSSHLYNTEVENKKNMFFDKCLFDKHFCADNDSYIDIVDGSQEEPAQEKTEENHEEMGGCKVDINTERIRLISDELEVLEKKLRSVRRRRAIVSSNVKYCTVCFPRNIAKGEGKGENRVKAEPDEENMEKNHELLLKSSEELVHAGWESEDQASIISIYPPNNSWNSLPDKNHLQKSETHPKHILHSSSVSSMYSFPDLLETLDQDQKKEASKHSYDVLSEKINKSKTSYAEIQSAHAQVDSEESCCCENVIEMKKELDAISRDEAFFECIRTNLKEKLEMHMRKSCEKTSVRTKKMFVDNVLSWNNELYCNFMQQHSFLHRRSEYMVNFKVSDIIAGNRDRFGPPGPRETDGIQFLNACSKGDNDAIFSILNKRYVPINVSDVRGNTGIFYAAVNCQTETIRVLVNLGAKLDHENDDGLFPLSMCLLVYMAQKLEVKNWEKSFLPDIESTPTKEQKEACSLYAKTSRSKLFNRHKRKSSAKASELTNYAFDTSFVAVVEERPAPALDSIVSSRRVSKSQKMIVNSIKALLRYGANPNVSVVPLPVWIMSIFTENPDLVDTILEARADVHITTDDDMTALHIISSLRCCQENVEICYLLLMHNLDPKLRTSTTHWPAQKTNILGKNIDPNDVKDLGKNALHILCMRKDFPLDNCSYFPKMLKAFNEFKMDFNAKYLGHTPLSLAVLVGNLRLVEAIMELDIANPYHLLENNMGNVLTIYVLKRYEDLIPPNAKDVLKFLTDAGVNPLNKVGEFDSVLAFIEKEHGVAEGTRKKKKNDKIEEEVEQKAREKSCQNKKEEDKIKPDTQKAIIDYIKELSRNVIIKYVQMKAVEVLYDLLEDGVLEHDCIEILAKFLTPSVVFPNLQQLFKRGRIMSERFDQSVCLQLFDVVTDYHQAKTKSKNEQNKTKRVKALKQTEVWSKIRNQSDCDLILNSDNIKLMKKKDIVKNPPPGLDDPYKYIICFHCLKSEGKRLILCPRCQFIYFCSAACNKANLKLKTLHTCKIQFYDLELQKTVSPEHAEHEQEDLSIFYSRIKENCEVRVITKLKAEIEMNRKRLEKEMKADIYGTRCLKARKLSTLRHHKTSSVVSLVGSVIKDEGVGKQLTFESLEGKTFDSWRSDSSRKGDGTAFEYLKSNQPMKPLNYLWEKPRQDHECLECTTRRKPTPKAKCKVGHVCKEAKVLFKVKEPTHPFTIEAKLRKIPKKYQEFIELLTKHFPHLDLPALLLPYACYVNGQLYYKLLDKDIYTNTYR